ncbi:hypothetical protein [Methylobacterium indicum]|uniref:hypothetical protein n=1 Tax=Methylobacterium indicum TaxID=1775910 RepID=UPI000B145C0C|nr:hypothetical protein [Methylobacterium indicum]
MTEWIVDTNVPIVANGKADAGDNRPPSLACRQAAVAFLLQIATNEKVVLDQEGAIQAEYRTHLQPSGQPGVGDRFYQIVLQSSPDRVRRVNLPKNSDGEYKTLPKPLQAVNFDPSDRKFAALAAQENIPVVNATDSDWLNAAEALKDSDIVVNNLCGCNIEEWFTKNLQDGQ